VPPKNGPFLCRICGDRGRPLAGQGAGTQVGGGLITIAREQGVKLLYGEVLAQNQPMLDMVRRLGFRLTKDVEGQTYRVEMELNP